MPKIPFRPNSGNPPKKAAKKAPKTAPKSQPNDSHSGDAWSNQPEIVRRFMEQHDGYVQLASEVNYTLTKLLQKADIKVAAVTCRAKSLESFLEKIDRKTYRDPFEEITDFAGARVVCFYADDLPKIESLIRQEFNVAEKDDKSKNADVDRFGYSATHFLVTLGKHATGARYYDLKEKTCEIQVRTVLQDAWAIFSHYLMYKHESDMPLQLKRKIHALAGALETADAAFQAIRDERDAYKKGVEKSTKANELSDVETNLDSVSAYLDKKFPELQPESGPSMFATQFSYIPLATYPTLQQIDDLLERTEAARKWLSQKLKPAGIWRAGSELLRALYLVHPDIRNKLPRRDATIDDALVKARTMIKAIN